MKRVIAATLLLLIALAGASAGPTKIVFWHGWGGEEGKVLDAMVAEFNEAQSDISVRSVYVPIGQGEKIMATLAGRSTPDVITIWDWMVGSLGDSGVLEVLNDRLSQAGIGPDDYLPGIWDYGAYQGRKYALPTTLNVYAFMWNKNLFRQFGLPPDEPPASIEELDRYAEILTKTDSRHRIRRLGFLPSITHIYFYVFGGKVWDPETGEVTANDPANVKALEWISGYFKKYDIQKIRTFQAMWGDLASPYNPFYRGQVAMQEGGQWEVLFTRRFAKPDFDWGVSAFPAPPGGRANVAWVNGSFWSIPAASRHKDEAFTFLTWLTSAKQSARFSAAISNIPPVRAAMEDPVFTSIVTPKLQVYIDLLQNGYVYTFPTLPIGTFYLNALNQALSDVQSGEKSAQEALDNAQARVEQELARHR